jgi:hypothetical protein
MFFPTHLSVFSISCAGLGNYLAQISIVLRIHFILHILPNVSACREIIMAASSSKSGYPLYQYTPSTGASILFCILFLFTTILHFVQMVKTKTWFLTAFVLGGLCKQPNSSRGGKHLQRDTNIMACKGEFIGYAARTGSSRQEPGHYRLMPFIIQNTYILIAPALFAATIYMTLGRIIRLTEGQTYAVVKPSRITKTFVWGDIMCFCLQSAGKWTSLSSYKL